MKHLIDRNFSLFNCTRKSFSSLFFIALSLSFVSFFFSNENAEAATFPWVQSSWTSATTSNPVHQVNLTNWTGYSTSSGVTASSSGVTIAPTVASSTQNSTNGFSSSTVISTNTSVVSGKLQTSASSQFNVGTWDTPTAPPFYPGDNLGSHHSVYAPSATSPVQGAIYAAEGWSSNFWRYSLDTNTWNKLATSTPFSWGTGSSLLYPGGTDPNSIYVLPGGGVGFWQYDIPSGQWTHLASTSAAIGWGGDAAYYQNPNDPNDRRIYATVGGGSTNFLVYNFSSHSWSSVTRLVPGAVKYGGSMSYDGNGTMYVLGGNNSTGFWKYVVDSNSSNSTLGTWTTLSSSNIYPVYDGGASTYSPVDGYVYAFRGNNTTDFWRYSTSTNTWETATTSQLVSNAPDITYIGASLVYPGSGDYLYAFQGVSTAGRSARAFWKYSISRHAWTTAKSIYPLEGSNPGFGFSMVADKNNDIFAIQGYYKDFLKYSKATNSWVKKTPLPLKSDPAGGIHNMVYASSTNSIYVFAPTTPGVSTTTTDMLIYSIDNDSWSWSTSPYGNGLLAYSSVDNTLYSSYNTGSSLQKYPLSGSAAGTWSVITNLGSFNTSFYTDSSGFAYGEYGNNHGLYATPAQSSNLYYLPITATSTGSSWTLLSATGTNNQISPASYVYSPVDNSIYLSRARNSGFSFTGDSTLVRYSIKDGTWSTTPSFGYPSQTGDAIAAGDYLYRMPGQAVGSFMRYTLQSTFYISGTTTSSIIDLGQNSFPTTLTWNGNVPSGSTLNFQLRSSTTTTGINTATWYGPTGTNDYYTSSGQTVNSIHNKDRYFQYRAIFANSDTSQTATLNDITLNYTYFSTSTVGTLISSPYNTTSPANILAKMAWEGNIPASTTVKFQISTAPDSTSTPGTPGMFSNFVGPGNATSTYFTSATGSDAMPQPVNANGDQWMQYKAFLSTDDTTLTPTLSTTTLTYVVNAPPEFNPSSPVSATENSDGTVSINYSVRDPDTDTGTKNPGYVFPTFQYSLDNGSTWVDIATSTLNVNDYTQKAVATSSFTTYTATWNPLAQIGNSIFRNNAKIKIKVDDREAANNTASSTSSTFTLDTKEPHFVSATVDATHFPSATVTLSASDDSAFSMKVGQKSDLSDATYEAYSSTKNITLTSATATVYVQFKDVYGNTTGVSSASLPSLGVVPVKIDASYSPTSALITLSSASASTMKVGKTADLSDVSNYVSYSATANLTVNQGDTVYAQFKNNNGDISPIFSATLPRLGALPIFVDESQTPTLVTLSATASTSLQMEVSQYQNFMGASYTNYSTTTTLTLSPGQTTAIYARFMDANGNITSIVSATPPTPGAIPIKVDASQTPALVTLSATAATTTFQMEVSSKSDFSDVTYQNYNSSTTLPLSPSAATAYVRFKDPNGNISAIYSATPPNPPSNYFFQDLSNVSTTEWREFFAWGQSDSSSFQQYNVFRSVNNGAYLPLKTITDKQTNYIVDTIGLDPNSTYSYEMSIQDTNGNISFISNPTKYDKPDGVGGSDLNAPTIDKNTVNVSDINTAGASISWTSNKFSNSVVYYVATSTYPGDVKTSYNGTIGVPSIVTSHSVKLSGLTPGTKYYFIVESTDSSGNIGHSADSAFTFTTLPGPAITNVRTIEVKNDQAKVAWTTEDVPSDSTVIYSVNSDLKDPQVVSALTPFVTDHLVTISDLTPGVQYYYFVKSVDAQNNIAFNKNTVDGVDKFFSLQATIDTIPPVISNIATSSVQASGATVTWITDKPSTAQIEYGTTTALGNFTATTTTYDSQHVVMLNNLTQSTTYYFRVISTDQSGNVASSSVDSSVTAYSFTTVTPNSLSGAYSANITTTGATINWTSLAPSDSKVYYVATSTYPGADKLLYKNAVGTPEATTSHSIILSGLTPGTQYYFLTESIDSAGTAVQNASSSATFTTNPGPVISNVASSTAITSAAVSWNTNIPTDATLVYSTSSDLSNSQIVYGADVSTTTHAVTINGLNQGSTYYYYIKSVDGENNTTFEKNVVNGSIAYYTFQTAVDSYAPVLSSVATSTVGAFGATVTWTTNKPSVSYIEYGTTTALGSFTASTTIPTTQQVVVLDGLASSTTYYFKVISVDQVGNTASSSLDTNGNSYTFTTITPKVNDTTLPTISNVATSSITLSSANITWATDKPTLAQVEYGTTTALGTSTATTVSYNSAQSISLSDLTTNTTYYFKVISTDQSSNVASSTVYTFTTLALDHTPPTITGVNTTLVGSTGAIASWTTDKPSVSYIEYGTTTALGNFTASTTIFTTGQAVVLSNLASSTTYYFKVISVDQVGNTASDDKAGSYYSFITVPEVIKDVITVGGGGGGTIDNRDLTTPAISDIKVTNITRSSAIITFTTSKVSNGLIDYGVSSSYSKEAGDTGVYGLSHSVVVGGLEPNTKYYYQVKSADVYKNIGVSGSLDFTTNNLVDTNPTSATSTTDSFAKKALSEFNKMLDSFINNPSLAAVSEADLSASLASFASKVISAPIISGTDITVDAGADTATIKWTTDKESNSMLAYAKADEYDTQRENPYTITAGFPDDNVTVHEVKLQNLTPNTTYHFQTRSQGKLGPVAISKDRTFTTTSLLPEINNARFGDIKENQAVLNWRTDVPTKTTIEVKDSSTGKVQIFEDSSFVQDHNFALNDLKVSNGYTARIISTDANKNTSTPFIMPFFTALSKDAAKISNVRITTTLIPDQADAAQTIISWKTDKPATSKVWFSEGGGKDFTQSTPDDSSLVTEHTVITTLLRPGLVYKIVVESDDSVGNVSKSNIYTALTPKQQGSIVDVIFQNFNKTFGFLKK